MPHPHPHPPEPSVLKVLRVDAPLMKRIRRYRFGAVIETESEALRRILRAGLDELEAQSANRGRRRDEEIGKTSKRRWQPAEGEDRGCRGGPG
jgi:hypothetical protein